MSSDAPSAGASRRWLVLLVGVLAQSVVSLALPPGLTAISPALGAGYHLDLAQIGLLFSAIQLGFLASVTLWGVIADRRGDRLVLTAGMAGAAVALGGAALTRTYVPLLVALVVASMLATSVNVASARVAVVWFKANERGLALGIRQMSVPMGSAAGALVLPLVATAAGLEYAFAVGGVLFVLMALVAFFSLRLAPPLPRPAQPRAAGIRLWDRRLLRLGAGMGLMIFGQNSTLSYFVLFLTVYRHLSLQAAAAAFLVTELLGSAIRVVGGRLSDRLGSRIQPILWGAVTLGGLAIAMIVLLDAPPLVVVPVWVATTVVGMSCTGLSYTAAAEIAGVERAGVAVGMQVTMLSLAGALGPAAFGQVVTLAGWRGALASVAVLAVACALVLRPLAAMERRRWLPVSQPAA